MRLDREHMFGYLLAFPDYAKHLYMLKEWAVASGGTIR